MKGLENRVAVPDTPPGLQPTDPADTVEDNTQGGVDPDDIQLVKLTALLDGEIVASQEMLQRYIALEAWAVTLENRTGPLDPALLVGTELLLELTTHNAGLEPQDIIPSLEALGDSGNVTRALKAYAKRLLSALLRIAERIGELFMKIYEILTSKCRRARLKIVAIKARLGLAKGGRAQVTHIGLGSYSRALVLRNIAITTPAELYTGLGSIVGLADAATVSHLSALLWVGTEVEKIINSDSFPNPKATEARLTRAFAELGKTTLANACTVPVTSDPRFQSKGYTTKASESLLGNRTLYLTQPKEGSAMNETFGTVSYELAQTRLGDEEYDPPSNSKIQVMELSLARRALEVCSNAIGAIERFDSAEPGKKLVAAMTTIHRAATRKANQGGLDSTTADLLYSAATAYSAAATTPIRDILTHLSTTVDATLDIIDRSVSAYD